MKVVITVNCDTAAFDRSGDPSVELSRILAGCVKKFRAQLAREPGCVCDAPEANDKLLDLNGNTVGSITVITRDWK